MRDRSYTDTNSVFKASLLLAPNLKRVVQPAIGWPVYAVLPCRDFVYLFSVRDKELIPRIGKVVVQEYEKSGYPITTDAVEISDAGIRSIGGYAHER